jgi:hypothetical protein
MWFDAFYAEIYMQTNDCHTGSGIVSVFEYGRRTGSTLYLTLLERWTRNFNGDTYVFAVAQSNKSTSTFADVD